MKIESAEIRNYRMLKHFALDFEDVLSLVIGKTIVVKHYFYQLFKFFTRDQTGIFF